MEYICFNRFEGNAFSGKRVNIPFGTALEAEGGVLRYDGNVICTTVSSIAHRFFARNDDGFGIKRGKMTEEIKNLLKAPSTHDKKAWARHDLLWSRMWDEKDLYYFNKTPLGDSWSWSDGFYNAPIDALEYTLNLLKRR